MEDVMKPCSADDPCLLLIVEDDSAIRRMFHIWQEVGRLKETINLVFAKTCQEAVEILKQRHFEVILLDLALSDSNGLGTLDIIVASVKDQVPVIVFTGVLPEGITEDDILRHGAQDIIFKPGPHIEEIMRLIRYAGSRHRIRIHYLDVIARLQTECEEAKEALSQIQDQCQSCPTVHPEVAQRVATGIGIQRLERVINRIQALAGS